MLRGTLDGNKIQGAQLARVSKDIRYRGSMHSTFVRDEMVQWVYMPSMWTQRFNRGYWEMELFDRLVKACISTNTITYSELTNVKESGSDFMS